MKLCSARVAGKLAPEVVAFLESDDADVLPYDCAATAVHARRLHVAGLVSDDELAEVEERLAELEWVREGRFNPPSPGTRHAPRPEDVRTAVAEAQRRLVS